MSEDFKAYLAERVALIDQALHRYVPTEEVKPTVIHQAMRHSLFAGGKRLRPILALAAAEACKGSIENAMPAACALECLHTYSLIHDDLPCMDNDDLRRGVPTCHVVYGEDMALLAGDALQALAFELAAQTPATERYPAVEYVKNLAKTAGSLHLVGGQVADLQGEGKKLPLEELRFIHEGKTAALLTSSVQLGAMSANASAEQVEALYQFGMATGLAFQIIDDILDVTQSTEKLGKSAGKDLIAEKSTYPALMGLEESKAEAKRLTHEALKSLEIFGPSALRLRHIADYLLNRDY